MEGLLFYVYISFKIWNMLNVLKAMQNMYKCVIYTSFTIAYAVFILLDVCMWTSSLIYLLFEQGENECSRMT